MLIVLTCGWGIQSQVGDRGVAAWASADADVFCYGLNLGRGCLVLCWGVAAWGWGDREGGGTRQLLQSGRK